MDAIEIIFWASLFILFYTYWGYPALILLLGRKKRSNQANVNYRPRVSLLICAYNEEKVIGAKIKNALETEYPPDKFDIIVVSDGSADSTNEISRRFSDPKLKFIAYADRGGKAKALNVGMNHLTGDIVVFTDANVSLQKDAVPKLISSFFDNSIGCVVGNILLRTKDGIISGESLYSRYEKLIHTAEGNFGTMITVDGALYALRRQYVTPIPADSLTDDWYLASGALEDRKRIVYAPDAIGYELAAESVSGELKRKVRMVAGGYQTAFRRAKLFLNPIRFLTVSFMFFSHKLLRWNALVFMGTLFLSNFALISRSLWFGLAWEFQLAFYLFGLFGWLYSSRLKSHLFYIPFYFTAVNWGAILGLFRYLAKAQKVTWERGRG